MRKTIWENFFSAPAKILEKGVEAGRELEHEIKGEMPVKAAKKYWKTLGPGLITGAADDDPSGIATYSQMGPRKGLDLFGCHFFLFH
jgi:hypothetical protein